MRMFPGPCLYLSILLSLTCFGTAVAQLNDITQTPNAENEGIKKSLTDQIGTGRGDPMSPDSSVFIIQRDPFRSIMRGRQLFQRKFTMTQGLGPRTNDGVGNIMGDGSHGAGLADSCAACHGRPRGSAGHGGDVFTRPDSRDAPHLFGIGLVEMLGDEITAELRNIRRMAVRQALHMNQSVTKPLVAKGIDYGFITSDASGNVDNSQVEGVDADLRVKPFFHEGSVFSIREFVVGALNAEMGLEAFDPDMATAAGGGRVRTPSGLLIDGARDVIAAPPASSINDDADGDGVVNEIPVSLVDHFEFYLLNYFKPGVAEQDNFAQQGFAKFDQVGCTDCHIANLVIDRDRRVADIETEFDATNGVFNRLFGTAVPKFGTHNDRSGFPSIKRPDHNSFVVENIFADFKRHDLGPYFHERNFDGTMTTHFMTEPLWGVGTTGPYGHDGRSVTLKEVILRHGGEAQASRDAFANLSNPNQRRILEFLQTLVIFPPADTASTLGPGDPSNPDFPQRGHGSIDLSVLFNNPSDKE